MKRRESLFYAAVPPNVIVIGGTVDDYYLALARVEADQQRGERRPARKRSPHRPRKARP